jgi:hypothetical protein
MRSKVQCGSISQTTSTALALLYGVAVPYDGIDIPKALSAKRKGKKARMERRRLVQPFEIMAPASSKGMIQ